MLFLESRKYHKVGPTAAFDTVLLWLYGAPIRQLPYTEEFDSRYERNTRAQQTKQCVRFKVSIEMLAFET